MEPVTAAPCAYGVDEFLDWRVIGFGAVRDAVEAPFSWTVESAQIEYGIDVDIAPSIRVNWHPISNQFYLYWRRRQKNLGHVPDRADFDPLLEIPTLCPHICIVEPTINEAAEPDGFCRLMGTHLEAALGVAMSGRSVLNFVVDPSRAQIQRYGLVADGEKISHRCGPPRTRVESRFGWVESLYLPITDVRRQSRAAFGVAVYQMLSCP